MAQRSLSAAPPPRESASPPCSHHWPDGPGDKRVAPAADGAVAAGDDLIPVLQQDHGHFRALLDTLAMQGRAFAAGESVDYALLDTAIDYLHSYAHDVHHRLEECILAVMKLRDASDASLDHSHDAELSHQHATLESRLQRLRDAFAQAGEDQAALRQPLADALHHMVRDLRSHLLWEEHYFFPQAGARLQAADWQAVEASRHEQHIPAPRPLDARYRNLLEQLGCRPEAPGTG